MVLAEIRPDSWTAGLLGGLGGLAGRLSGTIGRGRVLASSATHFLPFARAVRPWPALGVCRLTATTPHSAWGFGLRAI